MAIVTWDVIDKGTGVILSNGNLTASNVTSTSSAKASIGKVTGKWYWEINFVEGTASTTIGVVNNKINLNSDHSLTANCRYYRGAGTKRPDNVVYGASYVAGDAIGVALDLDNGTLEFYKNGVSQGVAFSNVKELGEAFPAVSSTGGAGTLTANFGATPFKYPIPLKYSSYDGNQKPPKDKILLSNSGQYKKYSASQWQTVTSSTLPTEADCLQGNTLEELSDIPELAWKELTGIVELFYWTDDTAITEAQFNIETEPFTLQDEFDGKQVKILQYTDNPSTSEITVETETEPYDIYDEFGNSMEVLYYTDDPDKTGVSGKADLDIVANYSPLDEFEGDFEVVTWTDEGSDVAHRALEMKAVPKPQFVKLTTPKRIYGSLEDVLVNDMSISYRQRDEARYFVGGTDPDKWYVYSKVTDKFVVTDASTNQAILSNGMTYKELNNISKSQWSLWKEKHLNVGIFLIDDIRDKVISVVEKVSYKDFLPRHSSTISDTSFYILNTTAKIDIELNGNVLKGVLSDDDLTRVQYRVVLNNKPYFPSDGSFTKLGESPKNIELIIGSTDIKVDDWNTIKVEFQDFFGTTDYWQNAFLGTYSGLMFKDVYGQYYSSEIGEVLQNLDFGVIIAGQTTIEHEVILKNQYGYDVKNVHLYANTTGFPDKMECQFSLGLSPFLPQPDLKLGGILKNNEEISFFLRIKTELGATPDANGSFDIIVRADKA